MSQIDQLDFERIENIAKGFGWKVKQTEIKEQYLEMKLEKLRVEPETDITVAPT